MCHVPVSLIHTAHCPTLPPTPTETPCMWMLQVLKHPDQGVTLMGGPGQLLYLEGALIMRTKGSTQAVRVVVFSKSQA